MKSCRVAAKELAVSLLEPNLFGANVPHAVVEDVVRKIAHLVTRNQRNGHGVSQRGTLDRRGNLRRFGIPNPSESRGRSGRPDPFENLALPLPLPVAKVKPVAGLGLQSSLLNFRTFRPGKKQSVVWKFARHLKSMRGERKPVAGATADALHVARTDSAKDV